MNYEDITSVEFSASCFFTGSETLRVRLNDHGDVKITHNAIFHEDDDGVESRIIKGDREFACLIAAFQKADFLKWKSHYTEPVLDGDQWEIRVFDRGFHCKKAAGSNAYPEGYEVIIDALKLFGLRWYCENACCEEYED